ncbi:MAG: YncE family protein [bacterium]
MKQKYSNFLLKLLLSLGIGVLFMFSSSASKVSAAPVQTFGVVGLSNVGSIGIIDGNTQTVTAPLLTNELGSIGGGIFDVVITPDGNTTLISNFGDSTIYFIDTSNPAAPSVIGSLALGFFAEDIALTPDGTYALVTDGGYSSKIAIIDVASRTLVEEYNDDDPFDPVDPYTNHEAIAVTPDGGTVLTVDYFNGLLNVFTIDGSGHLTLVNSLDVTNGDKEKPVNVTISPDSKTAIVASVLNDSADSIVIPILNITGPGQVTISDLVPTNSAVLGVQSAVFNRAGSKAYLHCTLKYTDPDPIPENVIVKLAITAPGQASDSGTAVNIGVLGRSELFGVDTLAIDNTGGYLYVSNSTLSDAVSYLSVINLTTDAVTKTISFDPVPIGDPPVDTPTYPIGIAFWMNDNDPPVPSAFSPVSGSNVTSATPTINFQTDENATCRMSLMDKSYEEMVDDVQCSGAGIKSHLCIAPDLGAIGTKTVYIACIDDVGNAQNRDNNTAYSVVVTQLSKTGSSYLLEMTISFSLLFGIALLTNKKPKIHLRAK